MAGVFKCDVAKELIEEHGWKRRWLATKLGLSKGTLDQYLGGYQRPGVETIKNLAHMLGVSPSDLYDSEPQARANK